MILQGSHTVKDGDLMVENLVNHHNLSILATDRCLMLKRALTPDININDKREKESLLRDSETPLGVVLNGVMKREEAEEPLDQVLCSKSQYIEPKFPSICHLKVVESCLDPEFAPIAGILLQAQVNSELEI